MREARFQFIAGHVALDFVNTVANRLDRDTRRDDLRSMADVLDWATAAGVEPLATGGSVRSPRVREGDLPRVLAVRERIYRIFSAPLDGRAPSRADLTALNRSIRDARRRQHITRTQEGFTWTWDASVPPLDRALGVITLDAAALLTSSQLAQIRRCSDAHCGWLFLDESRGRRRRWCSMADCGNRNKARRHYERTRTSE